MFSIIIPIYNVSKYLPDCLDSIVNQTYKGNLEVFLVNDGSTDDSGEIAQQYEKKYPHIFKYLVKENGGLSDARNFAIPYVHNDYVFFIDSDDYIQPNTLETIANVINNYSPDLIIFDYIKQWEDKGILDKILEGNSRLITNKEYLLANPAAWNKIIKTTILKENKVALLVDPTGKYIADLHPDVVIDAILAKKNLGTKIDMANIVIALGPGFEAKKDVHAIIETKRGHSLGKIYYQGKAIANTGVPGIIDGYGKERVIHAPCNGILKCQAWIGDIVEKGQCIALIDDTKVYASISGVLRGILPDGFNVKKGLKMADIDPRKEQVDNCTTISDKARCIAGGVIEAILNLKGKEL